MRMGPKQAAASNTTPGSLPIAAGVAPAPQPQTPAPAPQPPSPATAQSGRAGNFATKWTAEGWLASLGLESFVANALLGEGFEGDQLEALRGIGRSDTLQDDLRPPIAAALDLLVPALTQGLKELTTAEAVTLGEMQDKFSQDTKGILEYGSLNSFYGGLEAKIGSPSPKVMEMMAEEHTARGDSTRIFTPRNYDLSTSPTIEWKFVDTPDEPPAGGWPIEKKIRLAHDGEVGAEFEAIRASGAKHRQVMSLVALAAAMEAHANKELCELGEPIMTLAEAMGLRMYTGPMCAAKGTNPAQLQHTTHTTRHTTKTTLRTHIAGTSSTMPCSVASTAMCPFCRISLSSTAAMRRRQSSLPTGRSPTRKPRAI